MLLHMNSAASSRYETKLNPTRLRILRKKKKNKITLTLDIVVRNIFGVVILQRIKSKESRWQLPFYSLETIASIDGTDISMISKPPASTRIFFAWINTKHRPYLLHADKLLAHHSVAEAATIAAGKQAAN